MHSKVYIETTIPSYLTARPSRNVIKAARQKITKEWWDTERSACDCFISQPVLDEAERGDRVAAILRLKALQGIPLLDLSGNALRLAQGLLKCRALPSEALEDATHIALSAVHQMDYLLTWNFRHIANAHMMRAIIGVCDQAGYCCPVICTPEELLEGRL